VRVSVPAPSTSATRWSGRALALVAAGALSACLAAPAGAAGLSLKPCRGQAGYGCGTLTVPLDHSGVTPGTLKLAVGAKRTFPKSAGVLIALSGGPGQSSVDAISDFGLSLKPLLRRYRLVTFDQRGTGAGALNCPNLQRPSSLDPTLPPQIAACEHALGPKRSFFSTRDTVADIESLRIALGADKIALMGVSYGTYVAQQYARTYPGRVDRLVLDSVVGPDGLDPFLLDTYTRLPRVMRDQCARGRCKQATKDQVKDLATVAEQLRKAPIRGTIFDDHGRAKAAKYSDEEELTWLVTSADLDPFMHARMPGALSAAARGDGSALLRLRRIGEGPPVTAKDLSYGLFVTTICLDEALPYSLTVPTAERAALTAAALAAVPPATYAPWSQKAVLGTSDAGNCSLFPPQPQPPPAPGPLPDVPALLLAGGFDMRTPVENAREVQALLPRATLVVVPGNGHDQLDTDGTGCAERALTLWVAGKPVGNPCKGKTDQIDPFPRPPRKLRDFVPTRQAPGDRGRALFAVMETVEDARLTSLESLFGGFDASGGGLHGGGFAATDAFSGTLNLRRVSYLKGLRVSGAVKLDGTDVTGTVTVSGLANGKLTLDARGGASGVLNGHRVRFRPSRAAAASHRVDGSRMPRVTSGLLRRLALRRG
jgi:pimeloyl-ACP methyl ester carboxylesterase